MYNYLKLQKMLTFISLLAISLFSIFRKLQSFISEQVCQLCVGPKFTSAAIKRMFRSVPKTHESYTYETYDYVH